MSTPTATSDPETCYVGVAGVKPREAIAEGGLGLTLVTRYKRRQRLMK